MSRVPGRLTSVLLVGSTVLIGMLAIEESSQAAAHLGGPAVVRTAKHASPAEGPLTRPPRDQDRA